MNTRTNGNWKIHGQAAFLVKYLPATGSRGSRVKATGHPDPDGRPRTVTVGFHETSGSPFTHAAEAWLAKYAEPAGERDRWVLRGANLNPDVVAYVASVEAKGGAL